MRRVTVNGSSYALPFETLLRPLTDAEYTDLENDILENGVLYPVVTGVSPANGRIIIEGAHRSRICEKHGLPCPVADWGDVSDDFARDRALALNVKRRHLTADELAAARAVKTRQVLELRKAGMSLRTIGKRIGEDVATVHRYLNTAPPVDDSTSSDLNDDEYPPPRITGRDGKSYPSRRPEPSDDELLSTVILPPPAERLAVAEEAEFGKLSRALADAGEALAALAELNGPRYKRLMRSTKGVKRPAGKAAWSALLVLRSAVERVTRAGTPARPPATSRRP